jgi:hypothetical protein
MERDASPWVARSQFIQTLPTANVDEQSLIVIWVKIRLEMSRPALERAFRAV